MAALDLTGNKKCVRVPACASRAALPPCRGAPQRRGAPRKSRQRFFPHALHRA
jgi:hypothetical protein